jgi:hypothetical protein
MSLKKAYLYLVSVISLVIWVIGGIQLLDMGLKATLFQKADRDYYGGYCMSVKAPGPDGRAAECTPEEEARQKQQAEYNRAAQKQRQASTALSMIIIAAPVWWFHWRLAKREV